MGVAAKLQFWGLMSISQPSLWVLLLGHLRYATCKPTSVTLPSQISTTCLEGRLVRACLRYLLCFMPGNHSCVGSFQIQGEQAQRVSVIGFQRTERLARPEDFGVCAFSSQQVILVTNTYLGSWTSLIVISF